MKNAAINEILTEKGFLLADGATYYHGTPALMADFALFARKMGVRMDHWWMLWDES